MLTYLSKVSVVNSIKCPQCFAENYSKNGSYKSKQRYQCKECKSTFFESTNTSIHYINNVDKWKDFVKYLLTETSSLSLKDLGEKFKISTKTAHNWKHKFLSSLIEINTLDIDKTVEMQLVYLPFQLKGKKTLSDSELLNKNDIIKNINLKFSCFLCVYVDDLNFDFYPVDVVKNNDATNEALDRCFAEFLPKLTQKIILKKGDLLLNYFERTNYSNVLVKYDEDSYSPIDNQLLNFFKWTKVFVGYSTKYIWNYLKWYKFQLMFKDNPNIEKYIEMSLSDSKGWVRYMMIKHYYREFISK